MTYNIHHGRGADGEIDLERIAAVILAEDPDLVALQEVDVGTGRAGGVDQAATLGSLTGMQAVFGEAMPYDGGSYGEAVLSRLPIESSTVHLLPAAAGHEPRAGLEVRVRLEGGALVRFVGTHLDHTDDPADRIAQARALEQALAVEPGLPTVLAGDLNDEPGSESLSAFAVRWLDALGPDRRPTWPADEPRVAIDHVFVAPYGSWRKTAAYVVDERVASDHRPVVVDLELRGG
jgi:endonuclease/exonuclease/phosphatase family metal-dependent hydrolase